MPNKKENVTGRGADGFPRMGASVIWKGVVCLVLILLVVPVVTALGTHIYALAWRLLGKIFSLEEFTVERFGQFGDSFGVVTSVATVLALVLLFRTYLFQQKEFAGMRTFMAQQTAWNVVLQLCEQYREMMGGIVANPQGGWVHSPTPENTEGKNGLREIISHILESAKKMAEEWGEKTGVGPAKKEEITAIAQIAFSSYEGCFRLLHRILRFIDELECSDEEKQRYARIPRSMLSNVELEAILINCLTSRGRGMQTYVERYKILNNYTPVVLDESIARELCSSYKPDAFGDNLWKSALDKGAAPPTP